MRLVACAICSSTCVANLPVGFFLSSATADISTSEAVRGIVLGFAPGRPVLLHSNRIITGGELGRSAPSPFRRANGRRSLRTVTLLGQTRCGIGRECREEWLQWPRWDYPQGV